MFPVITNEPSIVKYKHFQISNWLYSISLINNCVKLSEVVYFKKLLNDNLTSINVSLFNENITNTLILIVSKSENSSIMNK